MSQIVSDRLRAALERLDQAIDQLESRVEAAEESAAMDDNSANGMIAQRLDRMIERIELALAE